MSKPTETQIEKLMSLPIDSPVGALNLFQFNVRAEYQPGDPEFNTPEADVSGEEAYARYSATAGPFVVGCGGRVVFSTPVDQILFGPEQPAWDLAAIMYFPTRRAFTEMLSNAEFQLASRHRIAAFANHWQLHLAGDPFAL